MSEISRDLSDRISVTSLRDLPSRAASFRPDLVWSVAWPGEWPPAYDGNRRWCRVSDSEDPSHDAVDSVRRFIKAFRAEESQKKNFRILIHCTAGLNRSPAFAVVAAVLITGPDRIPECEAWIRSAVPGCEPNLGILKSADSELGLNGSLVSAFLRDDEREVSMSERPTEITPMTPKRNPLNKKKRISGWRS